MSGYVLSLDADRDLQDIYAYTDKIWGAAQGERYLRGLFAVFDQIGRNPAMGRVRGELGDGIRSFPHGAHIVFYMPWRGEVAIVRVLHGSMDVEHHFGIDDPPSLPGPPSASG